MLRLSMMSSNRVSTSAGSLGISKCTLPSGVTNFARFTKDPWERMLAALELWLVCTWDSRLGSSDESWDERRE